MSSTTMYMFKIDGNVDGVEFGNAWGWAPAIWFALCAKYRDQFLSFTERMGGITPFDEWKRLWAAEHDGKIKLRPWERVVLYMTYDMAAVPWDDLSAAADALEKFDDALGREGTVSHLKEMARLMREASERIDVRCVCWYGTSVSEDVWYIRDQDGDGVGWYNFETGDKHQWVEFE